MPTEDLPETFVTHWDAEENPKPNVDAETIPSQLHHTGDAQELNATKPSPADDVELTCTRSGRVTRTPERYDPSPAIVCAA